VNEHLEAFRQYVGKRMAEYQQVTETPMEVEYWEKEVLNATNSFMELSTLALGALALINCNLAGYVNVCELEGIDPTETPMPDRIAKATQAMSIADFWLQNGIPLQPAVVMVLDHMKAEGVDSKDLTVALANLLFSRDRATLEGLLNARKEELRAGEDQ
jgi:hypothetical protein